MPAWFQKGKAMTARRISWVSFLVVLALWLMRGEASATSFQVVQDRSYRLGFFLVVDALVENVSPRWVEWAEVSLEFYDFFDKLVSVEHTAVRPYSLGPGQKGTVRVVTPFNEAVRKIHYRFTWQQDREQFQNVVQRPIRTE